MPWLGPEIYRVTVSFNGAPSSLTVSMATCSCPVGMFCKHAVALLLVAGRAGAVQPPPVVAWRSMLSAVLGDASGEVPTPTMRPLALSVGIGLRRVSRCGWATPMRHCW